MPHARPVVSGCLDGEMIMPITPLHLGLLAPINHFFPKKVSNLSFILVTLWLDASAIAYYALGLEMGKFHGPDSHSLIAAMALSGTVAVAGFAWYIIQHLITRQANEHKALAWVFGAYLGGFSHILLDAMVHSEMLPFHPLPGNPFYWGGMEWVSLLLLPLFIWLIGQYALGTVALARRSLAALRYGRH